MSEEQPVKGPWWAEFLIQWCAKIGVPAAIAFWLLYNNGEKMDTMNNKLDRLITVVEKMNGNGK